MNIWDKDKTMERLEWQPEVEPYKNYCFTCGKFTEINDTNKLCEPCIDDWMIRAKAIGSVAI